MVAPSESPEQFQEMHRSWQQPVFKRQVVKFDAGGAGAPFSGETPAMLD